MSANRLHILRHIYQSYFNLRLGMGIIGILLPPLLWLVAYILKGQGLLPSMSAYYHTVSRDVFVGALFAIGAAAFLYKGYSHKENIAMNLAGIFAVGVAVVPTDCPDGIPRKWCESPTYSSVHAGFALLFFLMIAYVCLFRSKDTLTTVKDEALRRRYSRLYLCIGILMILLPVLVFIKSQGYMNIVSARTALFWMEALAIWSFSAFWLVKSFEIKQTTVKPEFLLSKSKY